MTDGNEYETIIIMKGKDAYKQGLPLNSNPYNWERDPVEYHLWIVGFAEDCTKAQNVSKND